MIKALNLKVFHPGNKNFERKIIKAGKGKMFLSDGIEHVLLRTAHQIEKTFPAKEYHLVPIGPAAFNFVHAGPIQESDQQPPISPVLESTQPA